MTAEHLFVCESSEKVNRFGVGVRWTTGAQIDTDKPEELLQGISLLTQMKTNER